jgi:chromosomal replication initiator protein
MIEHKEQFWNDCLAEIEKVVSKETFSTWFKQTAFLKEEGGLVYLGVPNEFAKEWLITKQYKLLLKTIVEKADHVRAIDFSITKIDPTISFSIPQSATELPLRDIYVSRDDNLNPRYVFDNFIVGPFNELAYAASQAVVKRPQQSYNPLFIYGGSGLGKTHLIQAIGNEVKKLHPEKKILYVSLEKFSHDYVFSMQNNKYQSFRDKYQKCDVLIIDDIQFISTKEGTKDQLFHLFNILYEQGKNIIFSSDKHPNHIPGIEDRLKTRFNAGMTIDIQEPDLESRLAILNKKISNSGQRIDAEVLQYIASSVTGSIREMEGIINLISMHGDIKQRPITVLEAKALIKNNIKPKKSFAILDVIKMVSEYYQLEEKIMYEKTRRKEVVHARQMLMYLLREDFNESYPSIGNKLGGKDHTTVMHSYEKIKTELPTNTQLMKELDDIRILFK